VYVLCINNGFEFISSAMQSPLEDFYIIHQQVVFLHYSKIVLSDAHIDTF